MNDPTAASKLVHLLQMHVPGIAQIRSGKRLWGSLLLLYTAVFPLVILTRFGYFVDSIISLVLTMVLLVFDDIDSSLLFREDAVEHWLAAVFVIVMPFVLWRLHRRYLHHQKMVDGDAELSQWAIAWREFGKKPVAITAMLFVILIYTSAFLCPFIAPFDPNVFQDGIVTQ